MTFRWIASVSLVLLLGCSTVPVRSPDQIRVEIPERPRLTFGTQGVLCSTAMEEHAGTTCVEMIGEDWEKIRLYYHTLEREVRFLCLRLGKSKNECRAED